MTVDDMAELSLRNARSEKRKVEAAKSPDPVSEVPRTFEEGEGSGHDLSNPAYDLEPKMLVRQAFGADLDFALLAGKYHADPAYVNSSAFIPQMAGILLEGFNLLQPFL